MTQQKTLSQVLLDAVNAGLSILIEGDRLRPDSLWVGVCKGPENGEGLEVAIGFSRSAIERSTDIVAIEIEKAVVKIANREKEIKASRLN